MKIQRKVKTILFGTFILLVLTLPKQLWAQNKIIFEMEKTECFGTCPAYKITIYRNRTVELEGRRFMEPLGLSKSKIKRKRLRQLKRLFMAEHFFEFDKQYTAPISDMPTTYLSFRYKGKYHKVMDYYGAPDSLKKLENEIGKLLDELNWKTINKPD